MFNWFKEKTRTQFQMEGDQVRAEILNYLSSVDFKPTKKYVDDLIRDDRRLGHLSSLEVTLMASLSQFTNKKRGAK